MILKNVHEKISCIPFVIIGYWLFCILFLTKCDFYVKYFRLFDLIDTLIVTISILHFIFKFAYYDKIKRIFLTGIVFIVCLSLCYSLINIEAYYFIYLCILFATIIDAIWKIK